MRYIIAAFAFLLWFVCALLGGFYCCSCSFEMISAPNDIMVFVGAVLLIVVFAVICVTWQMLVSLIKWIVARHGGDVDNNNEAKEVTNA